MHSTQYNTLLMNKEHIQVYMYEPVHRKSNYKVQGGITVLMYNVHTLPNHNLKQKIPNFENLYCFVDDQKINRTI